MTIFAPRGFARRDFARRGFARRGFARRSSVGARDVSDASRASDALVNDADPVASLPADVEDLIGKFA